ncbi:HAD-IA family hydrolase [Streptomyces sp. NPDC059340]|uniref:HAD-IA family hydrolase n=1 Tax=Streptomyces sp. NPDC059340 TaxID=3346806 RepID=UPI0036AE0819
MRSPKPAPDLYLTACGALGAAFERSVAFEDSATGISSARAGGLYVAVVPSFPGAALDHDWLGTSLADPELLDWAGELGCDTACGAVGAGWNLNRAEAANGTGHQPE